MAKYHRGLRKVLGFTNKQILGFRKIPGSRKALSMRQIHGVKVNEETADLLVDEETRQKA